MKKLLQNKFIKYILIFIVLILIYLISMLISSIFPTKLISTNVLRSSETLLKIGEKETFNLPYKREILFTFTDALMINTAYSIDSKKPIESFLLARKNYIPERTKILNKEPLKDLKSDPKYGEGAWQTPELYDLVHDEKYVLQSFEYTRYWHGYLVLLRPLLLLFDYKVIRIISFITSIILIGNFIYLIKKKLGIYESIVYFISLICISIFIVTLSFNEILVYYISIIASILILKRGNKIKDIGIYFFIVGSITNFIDLLTQPIITLGIPLSIYFLMKYKENNIYKKTILEYIKLVLLWGIGYGVTWLSKWILVDIILRRNTIELAINQILFRTITNDAITNNQNVLKINLEFLGENIIKFVFILCFIYLGIGVYKKVKNNINGIELMPDILTFMMPIVWYLVLKNHSIHHPFFTNRILILSIISIQIIVGKIIGLCKKQS